MAEENFKFGDKVVLKDPDCCRICRIWIVEGVSTQYGYVYCKVNGELDRPYFEPKEIKHLYKKDAQMLFPFLEKDFMCSHCEVN